MNLLTHFFYFTAQYMYCASLSSTVLYSAVWNMSQWGGKPRHHGWWWSSSRPFQITDRTVLHTFQVQLQCRVGDQVGVGESDSLQYHCHWQFANGTAGCHFLSTVYCRSFIGDMGSSQNMQDPARTCRTVLVTAALSTKWPQTNEHMSLTCARDGPSCRASRSVIVQR